MDRLAAILREAYGLVVDDGTLAAAILVWAAIVGMLARFVGVSPVLAATALALGLMAILVENVVRRARRGP